MRDKDVSGFGLNHRPSPKYPSSICAHLVGRRNLARIGDHRGRKMHATMKGEGGGGGGHTHGLCIMNTKMCGLVVLNPTTSTFPKQHIDQGGPYTPAICHLTIPASHTHFFFPISISNTTKNLFFPHKTKIPFFYKILCGADGPTLALHLHFPP